MYDVQGCIKITTDIVCDLCGKHTDIMYEDNWINKETNKAPIYCEPCFYHKFGQDSIYSFSESDYPIKINGFTDISYDSRH